MSALVEAARFNWAYQAELFRIYLEQNGLSALVFDAGSSAYSEGAITGVRVMVLDDDLEAARSLREEYEREAR